MNKVRKLLIAILAVCFLVVGSVALASCAPDDGPQTHTEHYDKDNDGKCDVGGEPYQETKPAPKLTGLTVTKKPKTEYMEGDLFDATGMVLTAVYDDDSTRALRPGEYTVETPVLWSDMTEVVLSYEGVTCKIPCTVTAYTEFLATITEEDFDRKAVVRLEAEDVVPQGYDVLGVQPDYNNQANNYGGQHLGNVHGSNITITFVIKSEVEGNIRIESLFAWARPLTLDNNAALYWNGMQLPKSGVEFFQTTPEVWDDYQSARYGGLTLRKGTNVFRVVTIETLPNFDATILYLNPADLASLEVSGAKTEYNEGELFDPTGMVVTAKYTDGDSKQVEDYTYSPDSWLNPDTDTKITVSYTEWNVTKTAELPITVNRAAEEVLVEFTATMSEPDFFAGDTIDPAKITATARYSRGTVRTLEPDEFDYDLKEALVAEDTVLTVSFGGKSVEIPIFVHTLHRTIENADPDEFTILATDAELRKVFAAADGYTFEPREGFVSVGMRFAEMRVNFVSNVATKLHVVIWQAWNNAANANAMESITWNDTSLTFSLDFPQDGGYWTWRPIEFDLDLEVGRNSLVIRDNGQGPNTLKLDFTVNPRPLESITVDTQPATTTYDEGQLFDPAGIVITAHYEGGVTKTLSPEDCTFTPDGPLPRGTTEIVVHYKDKTATIPITVNEAEKPVLTELTVSGETTEYWEGETFSKEGLVVTAHYSDGNQTILEDGAYTIDPDRPLTSADTQVTISYDGTDKVIPIRVVTAHLTIENDDSASYDITAANAEKTGGSFSTEDDKQGGISIGSRGNGTQTYRFLSKTAVSAQIHLWQAWGNPDDAAAMETVTFNGSPLSINYTFPGTGFWDWKEIVFDVELVAGKNILTITDKGQGPNTLKVTILVNPSDDTLAELSLKTPPEKTEYLAGETFDPKGMVLEAVTVGGDHRDVTSGYTVDTTTPLTAGTAYVVATYDTKTVNVPILVVEKKGDVTSGDYQRLAVEAETIKPTQTGNPANAGNNRGGSLGGLGISGNTVAFYVNSTVEADIDLILCISGRNDDFNLDDYVNLYWNGELVQTNVRVQLAEHGWESFFEIKLTGLHLKTGANIFKFVVTPSGAAPNIDYIDIVVNPSAAPAAASLPADCKHL